MNGNLNTLGLLLDQFQSTIGDDVSEDVLESYNDDIARAKECLQGAIDSDEKNKSDLDHAHVIFQEMRDKGFDFQEYEISVAAFLGIELPKAS